jgi:S-adenosyl-L-methionine hydrolase (adenosine-forming)
MLPENRPICFLSDFGLADDFVGTCKGVVAAVAPGVAVLDLTHDIPGFAVEIGAETLQNATRYMPKDTVYLAVVDPGVGTERRALALRAASGAFLVGPDNGLLVPAAEALGGVVEARALTEERFHRHPVSSTFHGRDVFAPVAAHLAAGTPLPEVGGSVDPASLVRLAPLEAVEETDRVFSARIISLDRFGNARLSAGHEDTGLRYGATLAVDAGDGDLTVRYLETFGSAKAGELILVPDSHWRLSLAVNQGSAARALGLKVGGRVKLKLGRAGGSAPGAGPEDA